MSLLLLTLLQCVIWSILIVITVYDFRHKIIPDALVYAFSGLSLFGLFCFLMWRVTTLINFAGISFFCFLPDSGLFLVANGLVLVMQSLCLVLVFLVLFRDSLRLFWHFGLGRRVLHCSGGSTCGVVLSQKKIAGTSYATYNKESEIPFAPFIILGTFISFFLSR